MRDSTFSTTFARDYNSRQFMHELSVAQNIIETVTEYALKNNAKSVSEVVLIIGTISGVIPETLSFALDVCVKNTLLENAEIKIEIVKAKARCLNCLKKFEMEDIYMICPHCCSVKYEITEGKELKVKSFKIDDLK